MQHLLGAHQDLIFGPVRRAAEAQAVRFSEEQRGARTRDAPPRVAQPSDYAVEIAGEEDGDMAERLVHLDPQNAFVARVGATLRENAYDQHSKSKERKPNKAPRGFEGHTILAHLYRSWLQTDNSAHGRPSVLPGANTLCVWRTPRRPLETRVVSSIRTLIGRDTRRRNIDKRLGDSLVETTERNGGRQELSGTLALALPTRVFEGESWSGVESHAWH